MDVYRIGVALSMTSNHAGVLSAMSSQLLHAHAAANKLQGGLDRLKLAIGGAFAMTGGMAILGTLKKVTAHAKELSHELATLKTFNLPAIEIAKAQAQARATTRAVPGSTESGNVKLIAEAYSMFGMKDALRINPQLSRFTQTVGGATGNYAKAEEGLYLMLRSGELMGKLVNHDTHKVDPNKLLAFLDVAAKVSAATAGKVNANTFMALAQQGGPALANMTDDGLLGMMMAAQGMGGHRAGTALTSLYQQFVGGTMTKSRAENLRKLGLVGNFSVGRGGHLTFAKGALDTEFVKALGQDPLQAERILTGAMEKRGITGIERQTKMLFEIIGRATSQRLLSDFMRNLPQMIEERSRIKGAQGVDDQANTRNEEDLGVAEHNLHSAYENLMQALAGPNAKAAIGVINQMTAVLNGFTETVRGIPAETLQSIGRGLVVAGAALTGAGAAAMLAALGPAGWLVGGIGAMIALDFEGAQRVYTAIRRDVTEAVQLFDWMEGMFSKVQGFLSPYVSWLQTSKGTAGDGLKISEAAREAMIARREENDPFGMGRIVTALMNEIRSWPGRLVDTIASMGTSILDAFKAALSGIAGSLGKYAPPLAVPGGINFQGGGVGSMIHKASLGAANSNLPGVSSSGLAIKPGAASGSFHPGLLDAARAGGGGRVTALNDYYHRGRGMHGRGLAVDLTGNPDAIMSNARRAMAAAGLVEGRDFKLIDEYRNPSRRATGGHVHLQFNSREAADAFQKSRSVAPPTAGPPPKKDQMVQVQTQLHLDGRRFASMMSSHIADSNLFPRSTGGMNTYATWRPPGTNVSDAA